MKERFNSLRLKLGVWCLKRAFPHVELWMPNVIAKQERKVEVLLFATSKETSAIFLDVKLSRTHTGHGVTLH